MAMIHGHGGDTVLVRFFGARYSQTPFHSHLRIFEKRSMYRTSISFGIVVSLASMYWAWYHRARYIAIRAKGQSEKKFKVF